MVSCGRWNGGDDMDKLYIESPNDAEVDALLSQLNDESILKLKVHHTQKTASYGFEYPTFTDGWLEDSDDDDMDNQLASSRFSSLKLPVHSANKKRGGKDSSPTSKRGYNWDRTVGRRGKEYAAIGGKKGGGRRGKNLEAVGEEEEEEHEKENESEVDENENENEVEQRAVENLVKRTTRIENGSRAWHQKPKEKTPTSVPLATELQSCKSLDGRGNGAAVERQGGLDEADTQLQTRFRALKAPSPAPPPTRNVGLENLMQFAEQQRSSTSSTIDWETYGSVFSAPSSPSTKLLGRATPRSSPSTRILLTTSVSSSCRCSAPSPLKLLKQVSSKTFPSKQQLPPGLPTTPPTVGSSDVATAAAAAIPPHGREVGKEDHKSRGGSGASKIGKDGEKPKKEKREKRSTAAKQDGGQ